MRPTKTLALDDGLTVDTFYLECLAHGSYLVSHEGSCFIIDPRRDVDIYAHHVAERKLRVRGILESHLHADFVSGHMELYKRYGATICVGERAGAKFPHYPVGDGELLLLSSKYAFVALPTPGHTPGCVTWLLVDRTQDRKPVMAFTGDTLFVGGCGRPDLVGALDASLTPEVLSKMMFKSLREKIMALPDDCEVLPAHGPGSPCGKGISGDLSSTIGKEKETNPALQFEDEAKFIEFNVAGLDKPPQYFPSAVLSNMQGAEDLGVELSSVRDLTCAEFKAALAEEKAAGREAVVLDTRSGEHFASQHIVGALNIPLGTGAGGVKLEYEDGNFAIWVGTLVSPSARVFLVTEHGKHDEAIERLGRIGYAHQIAGVLKDGHAKWSKAHIPTGRFKKVVVKSEDTIARLKADGAVIVDTRTAGEFACAVRGHVRDAVNLPLAEVRCLTCCCCWCCCCCCCCCCWCC